MALQRNRILEIFTSFSANRSPRDSPVEVEIHPCRPCLKPGGLYHAATVHFGKNLFAWYSARFSGSKINKPKILNFWNGN